MANSPDPRPGVSSGDPLSSLRGGMILLVTLLTLATLGGLGYGLHILHDNAGTRARDRLTALAAQQRQLIERVLADNREDIQLFASGGAALAREIPIWANANPRDPSLRDKITRRLREIAELLHYSSVAVFSSTGEPILVLGADDVTEHVELARQVIAEGAPRFVDLHAQPDGGHEYGVMSPVGPEHQPAKAALYFAQRPEEILFPLLESWPIVTRTGESALIRQEGASLRWISPARFAQDATLNLTAPLNRPELAANPAATADPVFREEALDYRGEPVMAYVTPIAGAPWRLLVQQSRQEIYRDILVTARIAILLALAILSLVYFWAYLFIRRHEQGRMVAELRARQALEERVTSITTALGTVFWEANPATGAITFLSDSVSSVTGHPRQGWATLEDHVQRILPEDREMFQSALANLQPNQDHRVEYRLNTADNRVIWIEDQFRLDMDTGEMPIVRGLARDISARKQIETSLRESEQRFGEVVERIPVGIYTLRYITRDETARFEYLSDRMCEIIGIDNATVLENAHAAFQRCLPEDLPRLQAANWESAMTGQPFRFEGQFYVHDDIRWLRLNSTPVFLPNGDSLWNGVVIDVTDIKRSELAFQRLQQELTLILDGLPAQIWYKDTNNRMLRVNAQVAKTLGRPKSEIEGRDTKEYYPEEADRYYQDDLAILESGLSRLDIIEPITYPNGERRWVRTDKVPLIGEDGHTQRILVTSTDVTELHETTAALQLEIETRIEREREIRQLGRQFAALSQINQTLLRGQTREQIFQDICRIQVEAGQVAMAWVGWIDTETRRVVPVAAFGDDSGYLDNISIYADDRPEGRGPTGTSVREDRPVIVPDFFQDPSTLPWRAAAHRANWVCSASLPIHMEGKVRGSFTLYGREPDTFTPEAIALLKQSAANLSYALDLFAREERRQQAEEEVTRAAERYARMLESTKDAFWLVDATTGRLLDVNATAVALLGYPREELLSLRVSDLDANFDQAAYEASVARFIESGGALIETRHRARDGHLIDVEVSTVPDRASMTMIGFIRDISARKAAEAEIHELNATLERRVEQRTGELMARTGQLLESEERFRLAMAATNDGLWDWDLPTGRVNYSPGYARMLGYQPEELRPHFDTWLNLMHPEDRDATLARQQNRLNHPGHFEMEFRLRAKDGHYIWILSRGKTVTHDDSGNPVRIVGTHVDLTERKNAELALRESENRYRHLSDTLEQQVNERTRELTAALAAKSQFLANMSHEIRTPMNAVLGLAQLLEREPLTPGQAAQVRHIREAGDALLLIINDILDLSKIEAGQFTLEQTGFNLTTVLERLENLFRFTIAEKGLHFTVRREGDIPEGLVGDAHRLGQVLTNLCGNAVKFTERGQIEVVVLPLAVTDTQARLRFEVRDTGIGITAATLANLFQAFTQADESITRRFGGTGLGLTISKRLVELMQGDISAVSTPGQGSTFWIEVPFARAATGSFADPPARRGGSPNPPRGQRLAGLRVLVVDDIAMNRLLVEQALRQEGATTRTAGDGQAALELLKAQPRGFDVVLMDIQMPVMDGITATRAIRADAILAGVPVIAFTAGVLGEERAAALAAGMNDFLAKPVDLDTMTGLLASYGNIEALPASPPAFTEYPQETVTVTIETTTHARHEATARLEDMPGVNLGPVLELLGGDRELLGQLLSEFIGEFEGLPEEADAAMQAGETEALTRRMHTLKGTAANLGLMGLAELAAAAEQTLKQHQPAADALAALRASLAEHLPALRAAAGSQDAWD